MTELSVLPVVCKTNEKKMARAGNKLKTKHLVTKMFLNFVPPLEQLYAAFLSSEVWIERNYLDCKNAIK